MGILIAAVLFGIGFALLAVQNTSAIPLRAGGYEFYVPVFLTVLGSLLVGLFISWLLSAVGWISSAFTIHQKDSRIKDYEGVISKQQDQIHALEVEISRFKGEKLITDKTQVNHAHDDKDHAPKRSFFDRFRHPAAA